MNSRIKEDVSKIFEFWCEVAKIESNEKYNINHKNQTKTGIIIESFPESYHDEQIITKIPDFAYPCEFENNSVQSYSFVLTSDDSKWRFGFCRHDPKTQTAMILITYLPWHDTFLRLLSVLGELRRIKNGEFESFLAETYNKGVPELGASLKLFYNSGQNHFVFQRPSQFQLPSIPENHNLNLYYNFVEPKNMIAVFAAMLAERRIIFTSRRFDKLSSCIQAANSFLYPMVWQHIFIPVLPMKMKDILSAPMPYLIGVPESVLMTMTPEELGDVVILNCDNGVFQSPFDDVKQMPSEIISQMKKQLSNSNDHIGDRVSKIFLNVLVQLIGGYRDAVQFTQEQKVTWDRDTFIESRPQHLRQFLMKMMELQIFQQFIEERLEMLNTGLGFSDEFELETLRYSETIGKRGKHYKEFLRNVKEKTNPAVKSAVKSVKESSRGVKTAYKDLKLKLRDITPPKSTTSSSSSSQFHSHIESFSATFQPSIDKNGSYNGKNDVDNGVHYRSAPNSPVLSRRSTTTTTTTTTSTTNNYFINNLAIINDKKQQQDKSREENVISGATIPLQTSNSQIINGYKNGNLIDYNNRDSGGGGGPSISNNKSPTISPSSSLCSSDMNISQELQNHPLFKLPAVDRSLKPSNSLEYYGSKIGNSKYGFTSSLLSTTSNHPQLSSTISISYSNQKNSFSSISSTSSSSMTSSSSPFSSTSPRSTDHNKLLGNLTLIDNNYGTHKISTPITTTAMTNTIISNTKINATTSTTTTTTNSLYNTTNSIFDSPPDMPSPPIPPKRTNNTISNSSNSNTNGYKSKPKSTTTTTIDEIPVDNYKLNSNEKTIDNCELNSNNGTNSFEATHILNEIDKKYNQKFLKTTPTKSTINNNINDMTVKTTNLQSLPMVPIPVPRQKTKEASKIIQEKQNDATKDLILLDDSTTTKNTSFDLEDFDPLNQNAKPFPTLLPSTSQSPFNQPKNANIKTATTKLPIINNSSNNTTQMNLPMTQSSTISKDISNLMVSTSAAATVHNPLYPYFSPQHRHTTPKITKSTMDATTSSSNLLKDDDELELLRKYGLDQFTLTNGSSKTTKALNKSDWMVFE